MRELSDEHEVEIAVENMFPWRAAGRNMKAYMPGWDPRDMDCDAVTLDFSHAALSGVDSLEYAKDLGDRLRHVHLCDGSGAIGEGQIFDEHLLPGYGREPVAETLRMLADRGWDGSIVAEINTRKAKSRPSASTCCARRSRSPASTRRSRPPLRRTSRRCAARSTRSCPAATAETAGRARRVRR